MLVVFINGKSRSGKDTFCRMCDELAYTEFNNAITVDSISLIDKVREAASLLGYDEQRKTEKDRVFLAELLKLAKDTYNSPINYVVSYINSHTNTSLLFVHARAKNDIDDIKKILSEYDNVNTVTLKIESQRKDVLSGSIADGEVDIIRYDYCIQNNGTLDLLRYNAKLFLKHVFPGIG